MNNELETKVEQLEQDVEQLKQTQSVTDSDGKQWSVRSLVENMGLTRRQAIAAVGLIAAGISAPHAILKAIGTTQAQSGDGLYLTGINQIGETDDRVSDLYVDTVNSLTEDSTLTGDVDGDGYDLTGLGSVHTGEVQINTEVTWPDGNTTTRSPGIWEEIEREEYEGSDTNGDVIEWNGLDGSQFDYRIVLLERFAGSDSSISFHIDDMSNSHYAYRRGDGTTANGQDQITIVTSDTWAEGKAVCGLYLSRNKIGFRNRIWPSAFNEISEYALEGGQQEQTDDFDLNKITVDVGYVADGQIVALERRAKA